ncbi:hypothetical protein ABRP17_011195 [Stenotrophomonas sp. WHRI 8082]|uniref:hypothetical protein n=1 Tax=Stenotrophomonas sp. WHRI 8082 TaxID=3162571 RepID=UPI0032EB581A
MRIDRFNLRTSILLGIAVLAGTAWLATRLGVGGGIDAADATSVPVPVLPNLPAQRAEPLVTSASFTAVVERPVFAEDRRPHPFRLGGPEAAASGGALRLTGVLLSGNFGMATLSGEQGRSLRLRLNSDAVEGWQLLALEPRRATVLGPDGAQVLELAVFDGQGGEPPTVLRDTSAAGTTGTARQAVPPPPPPQPSRSSPAAPAASPAASPATAPAPADAANQGPSEEQMRAIRERIRARREQLQQQQQQRQSTSPTGGAANR